MEHGSPVAAMVRELAGRAVAMAEGAARGVRGGLPHDPPRGERWWPLMGALPAARAVLGERVDEAALRAAAASLVEVLRDPTGRVVDGSGHSRPVYPLLALHVFRKAGCRLTLPPPCEARDAIAALPGVVRRTLTPAASDAALGLWYQLVASSAVAGSPADEEPSPPAPLPQKGEGSEEPAPLVERDENGNLDAWTYRELVGLHALHRLGRWDEARRVALYHQQHTQPDYTTYQPWGLAAFASFDETRSLAEQQLHDVETQLALEGGRAAVVVALLLADAWDALSGERGRRGHGD